MQTGNPANEQTEKKKKRNRALLVIEVVCIVIALCALAYLGWQAAQYYFADQDFQTVTKETNGDPKQAKKYNGDCIGWIHADDTRIDYPVMYTDKDAEYYLHRNFKKDYSFAGTPFMGEGSEPGNAEANSQIVYAHHMRDGSMFGQLERFNDHDWAESHTFVYKDNDGKTTYHPFAAMYVDLAGSSSPYEYWNHVGVLSKKDFQDFVGDVSKRSLYSTKYKASYGKKIMMLSTCSYGTSEQRFVVFGVSD